MTRTARLLRGGVRLYQGLSTGRPPRCRYYPSCSHYAAEALERHGASKGSWLTVKRLARCAPWGGHGVDPVPD
jgi:putative membrane protein insertion efficiency factor